MTEIDIIFNLHNKTCTRVVTEGFYNQTRISIAFSSEYEKTYFNNLKFGYEFKKNHSAIKTDNFPKNDINYKCSDKTPLIVVDFETDPETDYQIITWCENNGERIESSFNFKTGRPPQPYASWSWDGKRWNAPIPEPGDIPRKWDENSQSWISIIY